MDDRFREAAGGAGEGQAAVAIVDDREPADDVSAPQSKIVIPSGLDLERIAEARDRSASAALVEALLACPFDPAGPDEHAEYDAIVEALQRLDDPRVVGSLEEAVRDAARPARQRELADDVLHEMENAPAMCDADVRRDWSSPDPVLRRHAVLSMDASHRDLIEPVLEDPQHPLFDVVLRTIASDLACDSPWSIRLFINALSSADPPTRELAAIGLCWAEPVAAEIPLLVATEAAEVGVVIDALETLAYYPTQAVVLRAATLRSHPDERVRMAARGVLDSVRDDAWSYASELIETPESRVATWLAPVAAELDLPDAAERARAARLRGERPRPVRRREPPRGGAWLTSAAAMSDFLAPRDAPWTARLADLRSADWDSAPECERHAMARLLIEHEDTAVRCSAASALAAWRDVAGLRRLLDDSSLLVQGNAVYSLRKCGPLPDLVPRLFDRATLPASGMQEAAFETAMAVGTVEEWRPFARRVVEDPNSDFDLRVSCLEALVSERDVAGVTPALRFLHEAPAVSWSFHIALLEAVVELDLPRPSIAYLDGVDHLHVQCALQEMEDAS